MLSINSPLGGLDDDEFMEETAAVVMRELVVSTSVTHVAFPRKWIVSLDPPAYVHASPWYPDWQVRLMRNDPSLIWKPPRYHSGMLVAGPGRQETRCAILHYEPILCSAEKRHERVGRYRTGGGAAAEASYGPKVGERRRFVPPPAARAGRLQAPRVDSDVHPLTPAALPPRGCRILNVDMPTRVTTDQAVIVSLRILNTGRMTWVPYQASAWPRLTIGTHVMAVSGETIAHDGPRIEWQSVVAPGAVADVLGTIPAPSEPGEYVLVWDMVSEGECWFAACGSRPAETAITVAPGGTARPPLSTPC